MDAWTCRPDPTTTPNTGSRASTRSIPSYAKLRVRDILESLEPWGPPHVERPLVHPSSRRIISRVEARALASPRALR